MGSRYLLRRIMQAILTIVGIVLLNFVLFRMMPGSPDRLSHNPNASNEARAALRARWGLDKPLFPDQFVAYLEATVQGDFGQSFKFKGRDVTDVIAGRVWPTIILFGLGELIAIVVGLVLGAYSGWKRGGVVDYAGNGISLILYSMPYFLLGMILLVIFATALGWFPTAGMFELGKTYTSFLDQLLDFGRHLVLPLAAVSLGLIGQYSILMRSSVIETRSEDYVTTAKAKGITRVASPARPCRPERPAADGLAHRHQPRLHHRRRDHGRGRVQLAGSRDPHPGGARGARLPGPPGDLPASWPSRSCWPTWPPTSSTAGSIRGSGHDRRLGDAATGPPATDRLGAPRGALAGLRQPAPAPAGGRRRRRDHRLLRDHGALPVAARRPAGDRDERQRRPPRAAFG